MRVNFKGVVTLPYFETFCDNVNFYVAPPHPALSLGERVNFGSIAAHFMTGDSMPFYLRLPCRKQSTV